MLSIKAVTIFIAFSVLFEWITTERVSLQKRHNCKDYWKGCKKDNECCSKRCETNFCGPNKNDLGNPNQCKPLWFKFCKDNKTCCSGNCVLKKGIWTYGYCGPNKGDLGPPNKCKPVGYTFCKQNKDCCSQNCIRQKEWIYGYCDIKNKHDNHTEDELEEPFHENKQKTCGVRMARKVGGRIVGGGPAIRYEFPWQVGIEFEQIIRGGASIINERWILTAAHVFNSDLNLENYRGIIGTISVDEAPIYVFFDELIIHPDYQISSGDYKNDIALLHTTKDMTLYPKWNVLNSVCLPQPKAEFYGIVTASGWGNIDNEGTPADQLMAVDLQIQEDKKCENEYKEHYNRTIMICAGRPNGGKDSCLGDSGGPLVHFENDVATVVGIVSFGPPDRSCGKKGSVAVYTKVSNYMDWIKGSIRFDIR